MSKNGEYFVVYFPGRGRILIAAAKKQGGGFMIMLAVLALHSGTASVLLALLAAMGLALGLTALVGIHK